MGLYSKSISEIVAAKLNKGKEEAVEKKPNKKEESKAERERAKEEKRLAKEQEKEEKRLAKEAAREEKKAAGKKVKESPAPPPPSPAKEDSLEGETAVEMEVDPEEEEAETPPPPKVKTMKSVKVKKSRKPAVVGKKTAGVGKAPKWFVDYAKGMEAARGVTDPETVKETAQAKWQEKGMPQRVAGEREKHVSRMYGMMFGH
jgi:hypothetical protein